ncbi:twisted gastrulation protein-like protein 1 [Alligator mississippiensis]|uniref:Twisted gastrulation protein-like protein 1 n=1 Tax=Alligator mississippiensis TaxID=8496 RepID=A0A151NES6_ALLMI|nr:twisted gastrulation protein-like protein 1 [Alligator mississippiensis]
MHSATACSHLRAPQLPPWHGLSLSLPLGGALPPHPPPPGCGGSGGAGAASASSGAAPCVLLGGSRNRLPAGNMRSQYVTAPALTVLMFLLWIQPSTSCNKALCASDVSKCLIQELCQCRPGEGNCSCCKECMLCLGTLWDECCDCVGMCNPRNYSDTPPTSKSTVEELHEPIPSLFRALTEGDTQLNWNIVSFPVAEELSHHENLVSFLETVSQPQHQNVSVPNNNVHAPYSSDKEHMCTVVYFDDCMSIHQCKISCESMGASKYRWFHNACL